MTRKEILEKTIDFDDAINRIVRLEEENAENESEARELNIRIDGLIKENAELKKRNAELKGMYAHSAREAGTYKQFLELKEKENAELKEINTHTLAQLNLDNGELIIELTKAKELLKKYIEWSKEFGAYLDLSKWCEEVENFLKDSEVEK